MKNKELKNELDKFSDDLNVYVRLSPVFMEGLKYSDKGIVCEFGVSYGNEVGDEVVICLNSYYELGNKAYKFRDPVLISSVDVEEYAEYSAYPGDYFMMGDDEVFAGRYLMCIAERDGWTKRMIIKENPTKADLKNWEELAEKSIGHRIW